VCTQLLLLAPIELEREFKQKGWCLRSLHGYWLLCLSMQFLLCYLLPLYPFSLCPWWKCTTSPCPEQGTRFLHGLKTRGFRALLSVTDYELRDFMVGVE
jgi:hypothetical protein